MSPLSHSSSYCEVLIIGAGPTGLTLAIELARRGIHCRIIDQSSQPSQYSKALGVMSRTLELLDTAGLAGAFVKQGKPITHMTMYSRSKTLADIEFGDRIQSRYPYVLLLPQSETERILLERLAELGVQVERGKRLLELHPVHEELKEKQTIQTTTAKQAEDQTIKVEEQAQYEASHVQGLPFASYSSSNAEHKAKISLYRNIALVEVNENEAASLSGLDSGSSSISTKESIHARWIVGCDGAHSQVRHLLQLDFAGEPIVQNFALADVRVQGEVADDRIQTHLHQGHIAAFFPLNNQRYRVIIASPVDHRHKRKETSYTPNSEEISLSHIQQILDRCTGKKITLSDPIWMTRFRVNQRQVEHYRKGDILLAGDAAHIHSPLGGQGMNTGMQDAFNLGWKLALLCRSYADDGLLDSYEQERAPVGQKLLQWTGRFTKLAINRGSLWTGVRNMMMPFLSARSLAQRVMARAVSEIGIHYRNSSLVQRGKGWYSGLPVPGERAPQGGEGLARWNGDRHLLLIFPDTVPQLPRPSDLEQWDEDERTRIPLLKQISVKWEAMIDTRIVLPDQPLMTEGPDAVSLWHDSGNDLRRQYGIKQNGIVLIRPDGYIGFIGRLEDEMELIGWVHRIFRIPAAI